MISTSAPLKTLVISLSVPLRMTRARFGDPGAAQRGKETFSHREHRDKDDDYTGNADNGHGGRTEALRNGSDAEQRDGERSV